MAGKIVFFDIDDTLYDSSVFRELGWRNALAEVRKYLVVDGFKFSLDELYKIFLEVYSVNKNSHRMFDDFFEKLGVEEYKISRLVAIANRAWWDSKYLMKTKPWVKEVLDEFVKRGYTLGIASAGLGLKQWDKLNRIGILDYFEPKFVFITDEINGSRRKFLKDKLFYRQIMSSFSNYNFDEFVMIGDKFMQDVLPAFRVGFKAILYKGSPHFDEKYLPLIEKYDVDVIEDFRELLDLV